MTAVSFKAAMIQMRSGLAPAANIDAAVRMIGEAKSAGADYVLTPEMTNIMEVKRERLFATIVEEDADTSLATLRELARKLEIYLHIGSLAIKFSPDKAANRSFLIDPKGDIAARYDKIHMFDVDLGNGESYRGPHKRNVLARLPGRTPQQGLRFLQLPHGAGVAPAHCGCDPLRIWIDSQENGHPSQFLRGVGQHVLVAQQKEPGVVVPGYQPGCYIVSPRSVRVEISCHEPGCVFFERILVVDQAALALKVVSRQQHIPRVPHDVDDSWVARIEILVAL